MVQYGYGLPAYRGVVMQRGYGLGGMFRGLVRTLAPKIKQSLQKVGKRALKTGFEVLSDVSQGKNLKTSLKRRSMQNINEFIIPNKRQKTIENRMSSIPFKAARGKGRRKQTKRKTTLGIL